MTDVPVAFRLDRCALLVLCDQHLDDARQLALAGHFGEIEAPCNARSEAKRRLRPEISDVSRSSRVNGAEPAEA
jgi:alpha-ketoglutarate-dependent taurine dioxygenase